MSGRWYPVYVGVGSNLQMPARQVNEGIDLLGRLPDTQLLLRSSLYRSAPLGGVEQPDFVNAVAAVVTRLGAPEFLAALLDVEKRQGRERG
ncbi:MAG: 2-amino-4-hydroxy-6-hydroxymethyldihydropteridine diphosphokinase, partial [Proteobacteria bacterium]|nr:2-amino-4-hydroxy-6-hydroxymethyldihydropteridine diphosphokinase [Pseudomonadota bacterium]